MSDIMVKVVDQAVFVNNRPIIASGGIGEDRVIFDLDYHWDDYTLTCVFYHNMKSSYPVLMDDNTAVVPAEVMMEDGSFTFGLVGVKDNVTRTSEVVKYNLRRGVVTELIPSPTIDIYSQIVAAVTGVIIPIKVREINHRTTMRFWVGTNAEYNALTPESGVLYVIVDDTTIDTINTKIQILSNSVGKSDTWVTKQRNVDSWNYRTWDRGLVEAWTKQTLTGEADLDSTTHLYSMAVSVTIPNAIRELFDHPDDVLVNVSVVGSNRWATCSGINIASGILTVVLYSVSDFTSTNVCIELKGN